MSAKVPPNRSKLLDTHVCWEVKTDSLGKVLRLRSLPAPLLTSNFLAVRGVVAALSSNGEYVKPEDLPTKLLSTSPFSRPYSGCLSANTRASINSLNSQGSPKDKSGTQPTPNIAPDIDELMNWYTYRRAWHK
ncbi:Hypothetical protein GLP15_2039 [Giardia lamblia P15]|uniref:Uncharacterized protein n=1 Tax=Giardia intestinalis (strain P15) TaxID=658858 RepID=E1EZZ2_GIAIA|nr:Hypothetical protein GLP15_2039 [Giardia lamblia P15]